MVDAVQVHSYTIARTNFADTLASSLNRANARRSPSGFDRHLLVGLKTPADQCARSYRAAALRRKHPIEPQSGPGLMGGNGGFANQSIERRTQFVQARPCHR